MKKYKTIFSAYHTLYRLTTTITDLHSFSFGVCRVFRNVFKADKVVMVCKIANSSNFLKVRIENKKYFVKKGGKSILNRIEKELLEQEKEMIFPNRLIAPFVFTEVLGGIYVRRGSKVNNFEEIEYRWFISLCEKVSLGLKIVNLYQEQEKIMINYIKSLSQLLSKYVPTSQLHTKVITSLIKALGRMMKLSEVELKSLHNATLLHDAGKLELPHRILKKQKPLTNEELALIVKHPKKGVELLKNLNILKPAIPIILHHHERYDGKGYPSRLKKDKIPLGSRILAILDTFDAMYFGRPYKKECSLEEVVLELKKQKNKQFDPKITDIFLKVLKQKNIQKQLKLLPRKKKT